MMDVVLQFAFVLTMIVVGLTLGIPLGRSMQRQEDRARRREDLRRNPDARPRLCLMPAN